MINYFLKGQPQQRTLRRVHVSKVTIVGVGLLGGSIGMGLRERRMADSITGYVRRRASIKECLRAGAVDVATCNLQQAAEAADLVVLCTPIAQMATLAREMAPVLKPGVVVTDVGSVKASVVRDLEPIFSRAGAHFVGSHPMAGSERMGVSAAKADLFVDAACVVTPTIRSRPVAVKFVEQFWKLLGARVLRISPDLHDQFVSRSSHLPYLVAAQLVNLILNPQNSRRQSQLCANGFRDCTRVASGSPEMWRDIAMANRKHVGRALRGFIAGLRKMEALILRGDLKGIEALFTGAKTRRDKWLRTANSRSPERLTDSHAIA